MSLNFWCELLGSTLTTKYENPIFNTTLGNETQYVHISHSYNIIKLTFQRGSLVRHTCSLNFHSNPRHS